MTQTTGSFNIEYLLLRTGDFFQSYHIGDIFGHLPSWVSFLTEQVAIWGMVFTLLFVIMIVYAQIRLVQVEHTGFHGLEEQHVHEAEKEPETEAVRGNARWERIVELASSPQESDWRRAILEADIMLAAVMTEQGYPGSTVGEQLRLANPIQMTTLDLAWKAHKVRNDVAHGGESYELTERDVRTTIDYYRRVFAELGAI